jgi:hypothetical protein
MSGLPQTFYTPLTNVQAQLDEAKTFLTIKRLIRKEQIDFIKIKEIYAKKMENTVRAMDLEFKLYMSDIIKGAIEGGLKGDRPEIAGQIIDKTLQRAFFLRMFVDMSVGLMGAASAHPKSLNHWDQAWAHYLPLYFTVKTTSVGPTLHNDIIYAFMAGLEDIKAKNGLKAAIQKEVIEGNLCWVFYNKVIKEADYIKNKKPVVSVHMAEAFCFYSIIADRFKETSKVNTFLLQVFQGDPEKVDPKAVRKALDREWIFRVRKYLKQPINNWDNPDVALIKAWRGLASAQCIQDSIEMTLGQTAKRKLRQFIWEFVQAVKKRDIKIAKEKARDVEAILNVFEDYPLEMKLKG